MMDATVGKGMLVGDLFEWVRGGCTMGGEAEDDDGEESLDGAEGDDY